MASLPPNPVESHYASRSLVEGVLAALDAAGLPPRLAAVDLAPLDQFHARGLEATKELADLAGIDATSRVLDVGSGIGGPARYLAESLGCSGRRHRPDSGVLPVGRGADRTRGLGRQGQRPSLPMRSTCRSATANFDAAWNPARGDEHRRPAYACAGEIAGALKPGPPSWPSMMLSPFRAPSRCFPVPWARDPSTSFLLDAEATRAVLEDSGFTVRVWRDATPAARQWFAALRPPGQAPKLGLHLLLGPDFRTMAGNFRRNVIEGRVGLLMAVCEKS